MPSLALSAREIAAEAVERGAQQKPDELAPLLELLADLDAHAILEIGTDAGGTFGAFCKAAAEDALLVSVDLPGGNWAAGMPAEREKLERYGLLGQRVAVIRGDSHTATVKDAVRAEARTYDFVFIDGDHSFAGVARDYWAYLPLVRPGGLIGFHDIVKHPPATGVQVNAFWQAIRHRHSERYEFITEPRDWGGIGVVRI